MYLLILRGLPGSGKSTYAKKFAEKFSKLYGFNVVKCSADDYFTDSDGNYNFDASKLGAAHGFCKSKAEQAMRSGTKLVIIDNTNTTNKEMKPYLEMAKRYDYRVHQKVIGGQSEEDISLYHSRNIHGVPYFAISRMAKRFVK